MTELRRHPPQPEVANRHTDLHPPYRYAVGGHHSEEHPVHARLVWRSFDGTKTAEMVAGFVTEWTETAMKVWFWRHGEQRVWLARDDVEPCTCTELHASRWWPAP